jgi:hypothetical protein
MVAFVAKEGCDETKAADQTNIEHAANKDTVASFKKIIKTIQSLKNIKVQAYTTTWLYMDAIMTVVVNGQSNIVVMALDPGVVAVYADYLGINPITFSRYFAEVHNLAAVIDARNYVIDKISSNPLVKPIISIIKIIIALKLISTAGPSSNGPFTIPTAAEKTILEKLALIQC